MTAALTTRRDDRHQPRTTSFKLCPHCGHVLHDLPPDDALGMAILDVLREAGGRYVRMQILQDAVGVEVSRSTLWQRLHQFEEQGQVRRRPDRPKSGWRYVRQVDQQPTQLRLI